MNGTDSKRRNRPAEESLRVFKAMQEGTEEGLTNCIRYKMDMQVGAAGWLDGWLVGEC